MLPDSGCNVAKVSHGSEEKEETRVEAHTLLLRPWSMICE